MCPRRLAAVHEVLGPRVLGRNGRFLGHNGRVAALHVVPRPRFLGHKGHATSDVAGSRSAAKEGAAGDACRRVTFGEIDDIIYNTLKVPHYNLDLIGVQRVRARSSCTLFPVPGMRM